MPLKGTSTPHRKLQQWPVAIPLAEAFILDYRLLSPPVLQGAYMETLHKGEITSSSDPQSPPFSPRALPPYPSANKMLYLAVGECVPQSFLYAAQERGFLQYNLTAEGLHPDHKGLLNTTCTSITCAGSFIPAIGERYPESTLELRIRSTSMPQSAACNLTASITNQTLVVNLIGFSVKVRVVDTAVGQIDGQRINTLINTATQSIMLLVNEAGNRGFPLPATWKVLFVNTQLQILQNALMIGTDLRNQLDRTS